jgi:hypothetical protein
MPWRNASGTISAWLGGTAQVGTKLS